MDSNPKRINFNKFKGGKMAKRKPTAWNKHVTATMKANKGKSLKEVLKMAKKTYKK